LSRIWLGCSRSVTCYLIIAMDMYRKINQLITQVVADMNWLLANCSEAEAKPYIEMLGDQSRLHRAA
jgi:hypothetical protein